MNGEAESGGSTPASDWYWLFRRYRPQLHWQIGSVVFVTAGSMVSLVDPLALKWLIDRILPARDFSSFVAVVGLVFLAHAGRAVLSTFGSYCTFHANQRFRLLLRMHLFSHMAALSADYHESTPVGAKSYLLQTLTEELGQISADLFPLVLRTLVLAVSVSAAMIFLNPRLSLTVIPLAPLFFVAVQRLRKQLRTSSEAVQEEASKTSSILQEQLGAAVQTQLLSGEKTQARLAFRAWAELMRSEYRRKRVEIAYGILSSSIIATGVGAVLGYGGYQVMTGGMTIGALVAFYSYMARLFEPLYLAIEMNSRFQRVGAAVRRIREFLDTRPAIRDCAGAVRLPIRPSHEPRGRIQMTKVSFQYRAERKLLDDFDLDIHPCERIALVGPSGSGKSTIVKLIARVYDPHAGSIVIDGFDTRRIQLSNLRAELRYIPQRAVVFAGTIEDNLRLGNLTASLSDLERAAELAELVPLLRRASRGWQEDIGPGGAKLSGGERQRLALARVLLCRPRILVLDESTAELDSPTETAILRRLNTSLPDTTLILISHRLTALTWVDRIVVLQDGRLAESGTHEHLYSTGMLYPHLYQQQDASSETRLTSPADLFRSSRAAF